MATTEQPQPTEKDTVRLRSASRANTTPSLRTWPKTTEFPLPGWSETPCRATSRSVGRCSGSDVVAWTPSPPTPLGDHGSRPRARHKTRDDHSQTPPQSGLSVPAARQAPAGSARSGVLSTTQGDLRSRLLLAPPSRLRSRSHSQVPGRVLAHETRGNRQRDLANQGALRNLGWRFFIVWECELANLDLLTKRLVAFLEGRCEVS